MSFKRWVFPKIDKEQAAVLAEECTLPPFLALLLSLRGLLDPAQVEEFLHGAALSADPFTLMDMELAVGRMQTALDEGQRIGIYGDYDVDGVTATVLLYDYLKSRGADVVYAIPLREEDGYGLHRGSIDRFEQQGVRLIVTVDNGINAVEEIAYASLRGIDVVVTDHHQPQERLPEAVAVVDPHRSDCPSPFKDFAGVGVAFLLVCALEGDVDEMLSRYADLVALGTLADVMPLHGDNRLLVREGLRLLSEGTRLGLVKLGHVTGIAGKPKTASTAAFTIAPRLNAAGRMGSPDLAAQLLLCEDAEQADILSLEIQRMNADRQEVEARILTEIGTLLREQPQRLYDRVLVVAGENWHHGVLGILASRLMERYGKPCIVFSVDGDTAKGSGRSLPGFSLFQALSACKSRMINFGGHDQAAGLTVAAGEIEALREELNAYAARVCPYMPAPELRIDCKLRPDQIDVEKLTLLSAMEPFGAGNPQPLFGLFQMRLETVTPVGGGKHLRLTFSRDQTRLTAMRFSTEAGALGFVPGDTVNLAVSLDKNEYMGQVGVSVIVRDIRAAQTKQEEVLEAFQRLDMVRRRERDLFFPPAEEIPDRELCGRVYRLFSRTGGFNGSAETLYRRMGDASLTYLRLLLAVDVLREGGLIAVRDEGDGWRIALCAIEGKTNLDDTAVMQYLRSGADGGVV